MGLPWRSDSIARRHSRWGAGESVDRVPDAVVVPAVGGVVDPVIADLCAAWAAHPDDQALADLIHEFTTGDSEFAGLWARRDVKVNGRGTKVMLHPEVGRIAVEFEVLIPAEDPDQRLVIYRAAEVDSQAALDRLCAQ